MTDKTTRLYLPAVMSALLLGTAPAYANSSSEPAWDFDFHGYVNAHAVFADCDDSGPSLQAMPCSVPAKMLPRYPTATAPLVSNSPPAPNAKALISKQ